MPAPLALPLVPAGVGALQWAAGALVLVATGAGAGAVAQRRSQNRPQPETFQSGGLGSTTTQLSPTFPAASVPISRPRNSAASAPQRSTHSSVDTQLWARQQAELQRQTLHIQHQNTVQTLQAAYETALQDEMAIRINGRRVDQAIPVFPRRGGDAMRRGEPLQAAIDRTQAEHLRHAQAANTPGTQWHKFVVQRAIPGLDTRVLTEMTLNRAEAAVMLAQGHLTEADIQRAGVALESIRNLQSNARGLTVVPERGTPQAGGIGDPNAVHVRPHVQPNLAETVTQAPPPVALGDGLFVNDPLPPEIDNSSIQRSVNQGLSPQVFYSESDEEGGIFVEDEASLTHAQRAALEGIRALEQELTEHGMQVHVAVTNENLPTAETLMQQVKSASEIGLYPAPYILVLTEIGWAKETNNLIEHLLKFYRDTTSPAKAVHMAHTTASLENDAGEVTENIHVISINAGHPFFRNLSEDGTMGESFSNNIIEYFFHEKVHEIQKRLGQSAEVFKELHPAGLEAFIDVPEDQRADAFLVYIGNILTLYAYESGEKIDENPLFVAEMVAELSRVLFSPGDHPRKIRLLTENRGNILDYLRALGAEEIMHHLADSVSVPYEGHPYQPFVETFKANVQSVFPRQEEETAN